MFQLTNSLILIGLLALQGPAAENLTKINLKLI